MSFLKNLKYGYSAEYLIISPQKITLALMNTLIILKVLELGGGAIAVSIVASFNILSTLLISTIIPKLLTDNIRVSKTLIVSYLMMIISTLSVSSDDLNIVYISALLIFLSAQAIYYSVYLSIGLNGYRDKSVFLSRLETIGGFSWILGLILGVTMTSYFSLDTISIIISILSMVGFVYSIYYGKHYIEKYYSSDNMVGFAVHHTSIKSIISYVNPAKATKYIKNSLSTRVRWLITTMFLIQLSISIAFTHLIPYVTLEGFSYSEIFLLSLFSSTAAALTYGEAGRRYDGKHSFTKAIVYRLLVYSIFILTMGLGLSTNNILGFASNIFLFTLIGFSWGFLYINMASIILGLDRRSMSYVNLFGGVGNIIGIYVSGLLFTNISYAEQIAFSGLILLLPLYIIWREHILTPNHHTHFIRFSIAIHNICIANQVYSIRRRTSLNNRILS